MKLKAHLKIAMKNVMKNSFSSVPNPSQLKDVEARAKNVKILKAKNQGIIVNNGMRSISCCWPRPSSTNGNSCERCHCKVGQFSMSLAVSKVARLSWDFLTEVNDQWVL